MSPQIKSTLLFLFALLLWLSGCNVNMQLEVPEMPRLPASRTAAMRLTIVEFWDARPDNSRIGINKTKSGQETWDVFAKNDVAAWVTEGIRDVFKSAGASPQIAPSRPEPREGALSIEGVVDYVSTEATS
ncbi:MAG: hypothetical protein IIA41_07650, partial [SAR324 cluster bacterium]|nr:hypothetical protein [SAR324 cluster bacterium]